MLHDLNFRSFSQKARSRRQSQTAEGSSAASANGHNTNKVGLLPSKGWRERNLKFFSDVLIPHLLAPRQAGGEFSFRADLENHETGVTWLGHAGFLLQVGGKNILVDPVWALWLGPIKRVSHPSLVARSLPYIDLVLITHAHFDHLHLPSLRSIAAGQPIIVPEGVGSIVKNCAFSRVIEMHYWQTLRVDTLDITFTPTKHWGARFIHDTYRKFGGYLITERKSGHTIFHCGDSSLFDGFEDIAKRSPIDIALMPIGAYEPPSGRPVHMNPEEALEAADMLSARHIVPMHYGTFPISGEPIHEPVQRFRTKADISLDHTVHVLNEGRSRVFGK
jgi:L-ascorbate metabolism protein UlaG (beta-lactamase superfamily)